MVRESRWLQLLIAALAALALPACNVVGDLLPDLDGPEVTLVSGVVDGGTISTSTITFTVEATDNRSVASVAVRVGASVGTACTASGSDRYSCTTSTLSIGSNAVEVTAVDGTGNTGSLSIDVNYLPPSGSSDFDIDFIFEPGNTYSASQLAAFQTAADIWSAFVIGDVSDYPLDLVADACFGDHSAVDQVVDDLLISVSSYTPADPGSTVLGSAGPCVSRPVDASSGPYTTVFGTMRFNALAIDDLETDGQLVDVIVHEMGHVLGIGTNWESAGLPFDYLDYVATTPYGCNEDPTNPATFSSDPVYTGPAAVAVWQTDLGQTGNVPVEENYGVGTQCGHWDEETLGSELMTGIIEAPGSANPLSALSIESLADINYVVDATGADTFGVPLTTAARPGGFDIGAVEQLLRPIGVVDPATGRPVPFVPAEE